MKRWLILLPVVLGVAALALLVRNRAEPEQIPLAEPARAVRVIEVPVATVVPRALGYGNVEPGKVWEAVAEVSGKVVEIHPRLKRGALMGPGQTVLRIDPTDYELEIAQLETNIQATQAQLSELEVKEANTRISLAIEEEVLTLGVNELERKRKLADKGTVTRSELEQEQRTVLAQRQSVQNLQNTLNLIPAEGKLLEAQLARDRAKLESAKLDLGRTAITLPFAGRVAQVNVEEAEYVRQGDVLAVVDSIDVAEIAAQLPMGRMRTLIRSEQTLRIVPSDTEALNQALGLSARVWLRAEGMAVMWEGRVARFSDTIDPHTRTVGIIVEVDDPYRGVRPGIRPPLLKGLFVEVAFRGRPRPDQLVIPRSALHGDQVYRVDDDDRLEKRTVEIALVQSEFVVIEAGLGAGDRIVISDLIPAIDGMLLKPIPDEEAAAQLLQDAQGEEALL